MKQLRTILFFALSCFAPCLTGISSDSTLKEVEAALDAWKDRASARQSLMRIGSQSQAALSSIAIADDQPFLRRRKAISLLATFGNTESVRILKDLSNTTPPSFRCHAMQALAEIGTEEALAVLAAKLDDSDVCMKSVSTDPVREEDVLVCDETIRLLEHITGLSMAVEEDRDKRIKSWKAWWNKRLKATQSR